MTTPARRGRATERAASGVQSTAEDVRVPSPAHTEERAVPTFPSRDWMVQLCERVEAHPHADSLADALEGIYAFVVEPAGPVRQRWRYDLLIRPLDSGEAGAHAEVLDDPGGDPRLMLTARFDRWWQLINGELDPRMAIMLRRLKVSGDLKNVSRQLSSATPLLDALGQVDTQWPG